MGVNRTRYVDGDRLLGDENPKKFIHVFGEYVKMEFVTIPLVSGALFGSIESDSVELVTALFTSSFFADRTSLSSVSNCPRKLKLGEIFERFFFVKS